MNPKQRARFVAQNREHFTALVLRAIADAPAASSPADRTLQCPACRGVMHYSIIPQQNRATASCERHECLSIIGDLPAREPEPMPRRASIRSDGDRHYYIALNGSVWRIHDRRAKHLLSVGDSNAAERVFVARNRDRRVYRFVAGELRSLILAHVDRQFLEAKEAGRAVRGRAVEVDPTGSSP